MRRDVDPAAKEDRTMHVTASRGRWTVDISKAHESVLSKRLHSHAAARRCPCSWCSHGAVDVEDVADVSGAPPLSSHEVAAPTAGTYYVQDEHLREPDRQTLASRHAIVNGSAFYNKRKVRKQFLTISTVVHCVKRSSFAQFESTRFCASVLIHMLQANKGVR